MSQERAANKKKTKKKISRRDFIKKSGQTLLAWEGALLAGGLIATSTTSCCPVGGEVTNSY